MVTPRKPAKAAPKRTPASRKPAKRRAPAKPAPAAQEYMGLRAYARHRDALELPGATLASVQKALRDGRIFRSCPEHPRCPSGCSSLRAGIDPTQADQDWEEWTSRPGDEETAAEVRAGLDLYKRRLLRLKYERELGNTIWRSDFEVANLRHGKAMLAALLEMCRRTAGKLATMTDPRSIQAYLEDESRHAVDQASAKLLPPTR